MNKTIHTLAILFVFSYLLPYALFAQSPEKMSYQAVIRDGGNNLIDNQTVGMQISILQGSVSGTAVYVETHTPTTNTDGLISIEIGAGTVSSGTFSTIDWGSASYFIKTETDPTGGTSYTITGVSQLLSVPYALHAKTAESVAGGSSGGSQDLASVLTQGNSANLQIKDVTDPSDDQDAATKSYVDLLEESLNKFKNDRMAAKIPEYDALLFSAWSAGGHFSDYAYGSAVDQSGNVYVTGFYWGTATFGTSSLTSAGSKDVFLAKYNSDGDVVWVRSSGGTDSDVGTGVVCDDSGNIYVTGYFRGTSSFGTSSLTSAGLEDVFLAKYNTDGDVVWARSAGGTDEDRASSVACDDSGNVYLTGYYQGTTSFGASDLTSAGLEDAFLAKYNTVGDVIWTRSAGGIESDVASGVACDDSGNVYVTGSYRGTSSFGASDLTSAGSKDVFLAKYNTVGDVVWANSAGGTDWDTGTGVACDDSGNVYVTGYYWGPISFGAADLTSAGNYDVFLAKYNTVGDVVWANSVGGVFMESTGNVACDDSGNVYVTGTYSFTASFGATDLTSAGHEDVFLVTFNTNGNVVWARSAGGLDYDEAFGVTCDDSGNVYITGTYRATANFTGTSLTSKGFADIFIWKYKNN